jgi:hypothetical protein
MSFRIRKRGIQDLQDQFSNGLEDVADEVLVRARPLVPVDSGETRDSLHTDKSHSREWPRPAVFVAGATGASFFVHEGTVDTPAHPFLTMALDSVKPEIPAIMRRAR